MSDWTPARLSDLIEVKHGYAFKGEHFKDAGPGQVLLTPGNFAVGGGFQLGKIKYYDGPAVPNFTLSAGDLLVTMTDLSKAGDTLGYPALVPADGAVYLHNQRLGKVLLKSTNIERDFIYWLLRTQDYRAEVLASCTGSTVKHTSPGRITAFRFLLPPKAVRLTICSTLNSLDEKIELNRRMNETLEAIAQAIFRDWFVDFGPTRRKLEGATDPVEIMAGIVQDAERAQALADLFPAKLGDDGLPDGWEEKHVGEVTVLLKRGLAPSYVKDGILVINQKCIRNGAVNLGTARRHDVAKRPPRDRLLEEYDVVVNSTGVGTLGRVATVRGFKEEATADSHVTICRADTSKVSKLILSLFMEGQEALIETMGHGSTGQTELSPASLSAMAFPVAPQQAQLAFDNLVMPLRDLVTSNSEQSLTLATTRDLVLPKLMSGEIRLGEAVEAAAA
ncbi:restriction endonuclease subunit S [Pararhizobium sp. LjRoot255]|uniref:restriction endonuclease subunit S n=1 Tax=Pararhizobium sp. LjRoot255 TaxID=3342298 RepID=UPI003ECF4BEC